jgi:GNAT superfamily N-acetyltransferase
MSLRMARRDDIPAMERFLRAHLQTLMFMLGSLAKLGIDGTAPHAMRFWIGEQGGGETRAIVGLGNTGGLFFQVPDATPDFWASCAQKLAGKKIQRVVGDPAQLRGAMTGLDATDTGFAQQCSEPGFTLHLDDLDMPDHLGKTLLPISKGPQKLLLGWRAEYHRTVLATPANLADKAARLDLDIFAALDSHRVLMKKGAAVAMTGFNSMAGDVVQVGGVYTPEELRGRGYARVALALHLEEARGAGVVRAILFAANEPAAKTYRSIGFTPNGTLATIVFDPTFEVAL